MNTFGQGGRPSFSRARRRFLQLIALTTITPCLAAMARTSIHFQAWGQNGITLGEVTTAYTDLPWRRLDDAPDQRGQMQ